MLHKVSTDSGCRTGTRKRALFLAAVWATLALGLTGCDSPEIQRIDLSERIDNTKMVRMAPERDSDVLRFGFDLRFTPEEDAKQYLPLLAYLEETVGLRFELRFTPQDSTVADDLGTGVIQFAAIGAGSYLAAHAKHGVIPLVRGLNAEGHSEYRSVIVVAPDSPIRTVGELRGKRFAFGGVTSTQGHLIPRIVLAEHGIRLGDLGGYKYTGSHAKCAAAVVAGRADAGGVQDTMGRRVSEQGFIRIIHTSKLYPSSGIAANRDVRPAVIKKVKRALLDFEPAGTHAEGLYH